MFIQVADEPRVSFLCYSFRSFDVPISHIEMAFVPNTNGMRTTSRLKADSPYHHYCPVKDDFHGRPCQFSGWCCIGPEQEEG